MRRPLALALVLIAVGGASSAGARPRQAPTGATFVITGHGWGHGVGMSQYGAYGYAQHGFAYPKIIAHYFSGTQLGPAPVTRVRVLLAGGVAKLKISSADDFTVKDAGGESHDIAAGTYTLTPALKLKVDDAQKPKALVGPLVFQPGASPLALKRRYRGAIQVDVDGGRVRAINVVGLEQYLYGVVPSEMPFTWAPEALKAQAVAARSYALAVRKTGAFDLYPDTRSQVYLGLDHEKPSSNAAVDATAGKVVLYGGQVAKTYFFSTSGGRTASSQDVWGTAVPYLVSVADPYDSISPHHDWGPVAFSGAKLARKLDVSGAVRDLQASLNSSGRVSSLTVVSTKAEQSFPAAALRRALGLRSTWFSVGVLSLTGPAAAVTYGSAARLTGIARGLAAVTLEQRTKGVWEPAGALKGAADGTISVAVKPTATTDYRLAIDKVTAGSVRVPVAPLVRFYPVRLQTELQGYARPVVEGAPVLIQRRQDTRWLTVARATTDAAGDFTASLQLSTGTYRARVAPGRGLVPGYTPVLQVST